MQSLVEVAEDVSALLGMLPGVEVLDTAHDGGAVRIRVLCISAGTLTQMAELAAGANVAVEPSAGCAGEQAAREAVLVARSMPRDTLDFGELQLLGIHTLWCLHRLGLQSPAAVNPKLRAWEAMEIGA